MELLNEATGARYEIAEGEHTVGRGPWLQITDKRVSRDHAVLRAEKGTLALCPKHKNPCYYKKVGGAKFVPLCKDVCQALRNGDMFSLLPDDLVFKVVMKTDEGERDGPYNEVCRGGQAKCVSTDDALFGLADDHTDHPPLRSPVGICVNPEHTPDPVSSLLKDPDNGSVDTKPREPAVEPLHPLEQHQKHKTVSEDPQDGPCIPTQQPVNKATQQDSLVHQNSTNKPRSLPSWLANIDTESKMPAKKRAKRDDSTPASAPTVKKQVIAKVERQRNEEEMKLKEGGVKLKEGGVKLKPKEEGPALASGSCEELKAHPSDEMMTHPSDQVTTHTPVGRTITSPEPAPKDVKVTVTTVPKPDLKSDHVSKSTTATEQSPALLPVCPYGAKCYRKNPAHFREYSHPSIATPSVATPSVATPSDDSEKPECPYGADCYRQNPAHRAEYKHGAPPKQRPKRQHTKRSTKSSVLGGDSDDDDQPNTYDYNDSFIDDEEKDNDSSSYGEDEEDMDWAPDNSSEDVAELLTDAQSFIANKKLHKTT